MEDRIRKVRAGLLACAPVALLCLTVLYFAVQPATANHYHDHGCSAATVATGMVQGTDNNDGSYFSVVRANGCADSGRSTETCGLRDNASGWAWNKYTGPNSECSLWSHEASSWPPECRAYAAVDYDGVFTSHAHYPHSYIC
jgi:hypothetical protein